ncbi:MAG: hypothetical protein HY521_15290 [Proteobacteria bacterium]|nr:hypothetical protein [Pseudomonadota bacterium]
MAKKIIGKALMSLFVSKEGRENYSRYREGKASPGTKEPAPKPAAAAPGGAPGDAPRPAPDKPGESEVQQAIARAQAVLAGEAPPTPPKGQAARREAFVRSLARAAAEGRGNPAQAKALARKLAQGQAAPRAAPARAAAAPQAPPAAPRPAAARPSTPERQELLRRAMEVHRDKAKILDELPQETRDKLTAMAIRAFVHPPPPKKRQN